MIYNDEKNPPPLNLRTDVEDRGTVTRWAFSYPLREPGDIAVDSRKHIYVEDRLPDERHSFSDEHKALLDSIILHFDADGRFMEYLGQEGIGGTPFARINGVYASTNDELAVVCRHPAGWTIYWFDAGGTVLYLIHLRNEAIPVPSDRQQVFYSVDTIIAAPDEKKLYIKVDYYRNTYDESTGTLSGSEPDSSVIWIMDVEDGSYTGTIEVPFFENTVMENNRRINEKLLYSMLGVIRDGKVFLSYPIDGGYSILILSASSGPSGEQRRGLIRVDNDELVFNAFDLSEEGILSGLLSTELEARVVWWRIDRLAEEVSP
jgi:hypothetical protein